MNLATQILLYGKPFRITDFFRMGQVGWHWQIDDPNLLYRRRNRLTYTRDFSNAAWTRTAILSVTANADGVGDLVVPSTANTTHSVSQTNASVGVGNTFTARAKAGGYDWIVIGAGAGYAYFNVSSGVLGNAPVTASIAAATDAPGYFDCTITTTPSSTLVAVNVCPANNTLSFAGDGTSGVYLARAQIEVGSSASEYQDVPTTWAQAYLDAVGAERIYAWTDTAGTIPVTAIGDGIGLLLGREYGGARGVELASANYTTVPTYDNGTTVVSATAFTQTAGTTNGRTYLDITTTVNKTYELTAQVSTTDTVSCVAYARNAYGGGGTILSTSNSIVSGAPGTQRLVFTATTTASCILWTTGSAARTITASNISIREIPGTHLTQATGTAKPTLSARVNLLTYTEQFDNAIWTKRTSYSGSGSTITNAGNANPAEGVFQEATGAGNTTYTVTAVVTAGTASQVMLRLKDRSTDTVRAATTATITSANQVVTISGTTAGASAGYRVEIGTNGATGTITAKVDLRTADDASKNIPAYQRVGATATDHDTDGFPHAQTADGTDDSGTTVTGGGNTTGFFYCGALTVSGGAGTARTIWSDTGTNTGYRVRINASNKLELAAGNGTAYTTVQSNETVTAPGTYLLSAWDDGGVLAVQVNNLAPATTTRPAVSAGTAAITAYKDNGAASSYFNGRDYGSVYRQQYPGETAHNRIKRYLANVARITV